MNDTDMLPGSYPHRMYIVYDLYGLKHHIVEMREGLTDAEQTTKNIEDRATQPMESVNREFTVFSLKEEKPFSKEPVRLLAKF